MDKCYIYILKLTDGKYYVGRSDNPRQRIEEHKIGGASTWTDKYHYVKTLKIQKGDIYDEDKYTLMNMDFYGIENVRGGTFCQIILDDDDIKVIKRMIANANDECARCFNSSHFVGDCYAKKDKYGDIL